MLDVQVARADAAQCDPHDGVGRLQEHRTRLVNKGKVPLLYVCICFHLRWFVRFMRLRQACLYAWFTGKASTAVGVCKVVLEFFLAGTGVPAPVVQQYHPGGTLTGAN